MFVLYFFNYKIRHKPALEFHNSTRSVFSYDMVIKMFV